jgi:superfamily II DNA or RNA helicase
LSITLRDYQSESIDIVKEQNQGDKCLIALPTGSGKTIIFSHLAANVNGRVLIVVPSTELREQTIEKLQMIDTTMDIGSVQGTLDEVNNRVIVSTRQSLTHKKSTRMERMLGSGEFELVIFDECHQAVEQIEKILIKLNKNAIVVGFTATPYNPAMIKIFSEISYSKSILDMILKDYLVEPKAIMVSSTTDLSKVKTCAGDFNQCQLEDAVNNDERNRLVVEAYKKYAIGRKSTLVFASGVNHSEDLAKEFKRAGIYAKTVDSTLDGTDREKIINEFKSGKLPVLCNVGVLTTGFDYPPTDCVILCRPTKSRILFEQILGRGLRTSENKDDCLVIDIQDVVKNHDLMSISDVFDMTIKNGETIKQAIKRNEEERIADEIRKKQEEQERLERERKRQQELELIAEQIRLFNRDMDNRFADAYYDWYKCFIDTWAVSQDTDYHYVIQKDDEDFVLYFVDTNKETHHVECLDTQSNLVELIQHVENKVLHKPTSFAYRRVNWKKDKASDAQKKYVPTATTKWDATIYFTVNKIKSALWKYRKQQSA